MDEAGRPPNTNRSREAELFHACLELTLSERPGYLERTCRDEPALRERLERLLAAHERADGLTFDPLRDFMAVPTPVGATPPAQGTDAGTNVGDVLGPYRLERFLAEGGMGSVWLAVRTDGLLNRPVALKLPRGAWLGPELRERMAREREILAALSHPNIARLYDAGFTPQGRPYLALEFVLGRPIDEHCREKGLEVSARLRLFVQVASAVAHAHAKLVVHRDLKPANVLVTEEGQVRLLDFGIASLLEGGQVRDSALTRASGRVFTPDYASPEQLAGKPVTIATDVYSLGVMLCELLAGVHPFAGSRAGSPAEPGTRADPPLASRLAADEGSRRTLRGDLDAIVRKALRVDPDERYATVNALIDDVERYLSGRPVTAQPDRWVYRMRKLVARHRLATAGASTALLAVLMGAGVAVWQARIARAEKERAEEVKDFITSIFSEADPYQGGGRALTAVDLLKQAHAKVDRTFETRPGLRVELLGLVASSLIGLEDYAAAEAVLRDAVEVASRALGPNDPRTLHLRVRRTDAYRYLGKTKEMGEELRALSAELRRDPSRSPDDLAAVVKNLAHLAIDEARYEEARALAQEARDLFLARYGERHQSTLGASMLLAVSYQYLDQPELALSAAGIAYRSSLALYGERSPHPRVIDARGVHGRALGNAGQLEAGIEQLTRVVAEASALFGPKSPMVGFYSADLAKYHAEAGDLALGIEHAERSFEILTGLAKRGSFTHAAALQRRGISLLAARRLEPALRDLNGAADGLAQALGAEHPRALAARALRALAAARLGDTAAAAADVEAVVQRYRASGERSISRGLYALGVIRRLAGDPEAAVRAQLEAMESAPEGDRGERERMLVRAEIGLAELSAGRVAPAATSLEQALGLFRRLQRGTTPERAEVLVGLGRAWMDQGRAPAALALLQEADAFWRELDPRGRDAGEAALWLGRCYRVLHRNEDAARAWARAERIRSATGRSGVRELRPGAAGR
jgi:serine/threonine-protein kinase